MGRDLFVNELKCAPGGSAKPPGAARTGQVLPWDEPRINHNSEIRPDRYGRVTVCAKGAARFFSRRAGINVIARRRNAPESCGAGKLPNANALTGSHPLTKSGMPRRRRNVGGPELQHGTIPLPAKKPPARTARGHVAKKFPPNSATAPDAMNRCLTTRVPRRGTAGRIADGPCDECVIANISG